MTVPIYRQRDVEIWRTKIGGKLRKQITCSKLLVALAKIIAPLLAHRKRKSKETFKSKFFCENILWYIIHIYNQWSLYFWYLVQSSLNSKYIYRNSRRYIFEISGCTNLFYFLYFPLFLSLVSKWNDINLVSLIKQLLAASIHHIQCNNGHLIVCLSRASFIIWRCYLMSPVPYSPRNDAIRTTKG